MTQIASVRLTYYADVISSWCHYAEPVWNMLRQRYSGRVQFDWRIALMKEQDLPATRAECDWYYRRSGTITASQIMLNSGWLDSMKNGGLLTANLVAETTRDFLEPGDNRGLIALTHAALLHGQPIGHLDNAATTVAQALNIPQDQLRERSLSPEVRARVEASTQEFFAHQLNQRPSWILTNDIGDKTTFSGLVRPEPLIAALDALLADSAAYASYRAHHGTPTA